MDKLHKKAILVLSRAFCIISDRWTNRGFKIRQEDGSYKVDVIGAIALAQEQLFDQHGSDSYRDSDLAINLITETAEKHFNRSAVSVNDELGYISTIKLYALAIERGITHGFDACANVERSERPRGRITPRTDSD